MFFSMWTVNEAAIHLTENGGNIMFIFVLITLFASIASVEFLVTAKRGIEGQIS